MCKDDLKHVRMMFRRSGRISQMIRPFFFFFYLLTRKSYLFADISWFWSTIQFSWSGRYSFVYFVNCDRKITSYDVKLMITKMFSGSQQVSIYLPQHPGVFRAAVERALLRSSSLLPWRDTTSVAGTAGPAVLGWSPENRPKRFSHL